MNSKPVLALIAVAALVIAACEDTTQPPPPGAPPQISTSATYQRSVDTGLPSNDVFSILVTSEGEVWIGTQAGIAIYPNISSTKRSGDVINELNGLPNPQVRSMAEYNGKIYAATWGGGLGVFDMGTDQWSQLKTAQGLRAGEVADIAISPTEDRLYFATANGVSIYNPTANSFSSFIPPNLLDPIVSSVDLRDVGGVIERWYGPRYEPFLTTADRSKHGITVSRGTSTVIKYTLANSDLAEARVNDVYYDSQNDVFWVSYAVSGIAIVNTANSTWTYQTTVNGLPSNTVYNVTRAAGTMWAATQHGLARLKTDGRWQGYSRSGGLQADRVRRVYSDDGERLWLAFIEGGAARVNPASAK
ncbi:MAG TPA: two-component regulator propeller domain-containing protein [Candidatus Krumholzibacteria bacterium]|nr:two-component regulator propeller domain-containing protein [Candidatus Krumholzibacteria bacterium]